MSPRLLLLALLCLVCLFAGPARAASCPPHELTPPERVRIAGDALMVVVHPSATYDARYSSKRGIDEAVRFAKEKGIPVIYLQDDSPLEHYFPADCAPDHWVYSEGGEVRFEADPAHLYIVGGHLELCMSIALHDIIQQWAKRAPRNRTVTYFMDAVYSNGKLVEASAPYYHDFDRFMGVVTHGRPGGEHWPKLNLLETMGVILREEHELQYLTEALPRWDQTFPKNYRIELQLNESVKKVLRAAPGWRPPTVLFHFIDSAYNLRFPPQP